MNIWVCIKQVAESESYFSSAQDVSWIAAKDETIWCMNRFDEHALEAALQIKEQVAQATVTVVSLGPERVKDVIRRAMGMGADNGLHINTAGQGYEGPLFVGDCMATLIARHPHDLVLTGVMSQDLMAGQTGQVVARKLGIPCSAAVMSISSIKEDSLRVEKEMTSGVRRRLQLKLPALLTVQAGSNAPRYPNISKVLKANRKEIATIEAEELTSLAKMPEQAVKIQLSQKSRKCIFIEGSIKEKATALAKIAAAKNLVRHALANE